MADSRSKCVVDTSLLIDLHLGKIIVNLFELPYRFIAPDVIIAEVQTIDVKMLSRYGLEQSELAGEQILKSLCEQGSRLPQEECDRRLRDWQKSAC